MDDDTTRRFDSYALSARPIRPEDIASLHVLSVGVNWPHRTEDWALLVSLGAGVVAEDEIGRVIGSAMWFPMGGDLVSVGMVITTPRLQEHGAGRWLMRQILGEIGARDMVLNATRAAFRLYLSLGFRPGRTVVQHQGVAAPDGAAPPSAARPMRAEDVPAIRALDAAALTSERRAVLDALLGLSRGSVLERDGAIVGYALCRSFGRGHVVGPVVAERDADAIALIAPHVAAHAGRFLRVDTREEEGAFRDWLAARGMTRYDTVTSMSLGRARPAPGPVRAFGLASQALG